MLKISDIDSLLVENLRLVMIHNYYLEAAGVNIEDSVNKDEEKYLDEAGNTSTDLLLRYNTAAKTEREAVKEEPIVNKLKEIEDKAAAKKERENQEKSKIIRFFSLSSFMFSESTFLLPRVFRNHN